MRTKPRILARLANTDSRSKPAETSAKQAREDGKEGDRGTQHTTQEERKGNSRTKLANQPANRTGELSRRGQRLAKKEGTARERSRRARMRANPGKGKGTQLAKARWNCPARQKRSPAKNAITSSYELRLSRFELLCVANAKSHPTKSGYLPLEVLKKGWWKNKLYRRLPNEQEHEIGIAEPIATPTHLISGLESSRPWLIRPCPTIISPEMKTMTPRTLTGQPSLKPTVRWILTRTTY